MAFWGILGNVLKSAVGLGGIGAAAGGAAKGAEAERLTAADYALGRDRLGLDASGQNERALQDRASLELDREKAQRDAQSDAYLKAIRGALARNFTPTSRPSGVPTISFVGKGIGDSAAPAELERQAMLQLLDAGKPRTALPEYTPYALQSQATLPKASTFEKLAGILGLGATAASGLVGAGGNKLPGQLVAVPSFKKGVPV